MHWGDSIEHGSHLVNNKAYAGEVYFLIIIKYSIKHQMKQLIRAIMMAY